MTPEEKSFLLDIIDSIIGHDPNISELKDNFGEETVLIVETMLEELEKCNNSFRELLAGLVSGGRLRAKGWLRRIIGSVAREIKRSNINFYVCSVNIKIKYKSILINSAV